MLVFGFYPREGDYPVAFSKQVVFSWFGEELEGMAGSGVSCAHQVGVVDGWAPFGKGTGGLWRRWCLLREQRLKYVEVWREHTFLSN